MQFSLIIPAYNEERRIGKTLGAYDKFLEKKFRDFEILVVFDGNDKTDEVVKRLSAKMKKIKLLKFRRRLGKGGGVIEGIKAAKGEIIGYTDADNSVPPDEYWKLVSALPGHSCVAASRYSKGALQVKSQSFANRFASRAWNLIVNLLFGLGMKDTQCGAKVFTKDVKKVVHKMKSTDFSFDVELLWRMKKFGKIKEQSVKWTHVEEDSKTRLSNSAGMLLSVLKVRLFG